MAMIMLSHTEDLFIDEEHDLNGSGDQKWVLTVCERKSRCGYRLR